MLQIGPFTSMNMGPMRDEFVQIESDPAGEKKIDEHGRLLGDREYRIKTFTLPGRGEKLYMMATECAKELAYRDSYLLFNKNKSLYKMIASQQDKEKLINLQYLPWAFRSRQIALVTARSMYIQFGSRVVRNGKRVRDDYWESKAIEQGFTEDDPVLQERKIVAGSSPSTPQGGSAGIGGPGGGFTHQRTSSRNLAASMAAGGGNQNGMSGPGGIGASGGNGSGSLSGSGATGVFIPGSGINGSFDFQDVGGISSKKKDGLMAADTESALMEGQKLVSQFNKYLNDQRKQRIDMWGQFWTMRQKQQEELLTNGIRDYLENETDDEAVIQQRQQQLSSVIPQPQPGALEGDPPPSMVMPNPPLSQPRGGPQGGPQAGNMGQVPAQVQAQAQAQAQAYQKYRRASQQSSPAQFVRQQAQFPQQQQQPPHAQYAQYGAQQNQWRAAPQQPHGPPHMQQQQQQWGYYQ